MAEIKDRDSQILQNVSYKVLLMLAGNYEGSYLILFVEYDNNITTKTKQKCPRIISDD